VRKTVLNVWIFVMPQGGMRPSPLGMSATNWFINLLIIYLQSQLRVLFDVIISLVSQHVSAPLGHPQVNHNILFILS
jgi:hypothetical protein